MNKGYFLGIVFIVSGLFIVSAFLALKSVFIPAIPTENPADNSPQITSGALITPTLTPHTYDNQKKADINSVIRPVLEIWRSDYKRYPDTLSELVPKYLVIMPLDPTTKSEYFYQVSSTKLDYTISVDLDDGTRYVIHAPQ